jgi:hypothetical protein
MLMNPSLFFYVFVLPDILRCFWVIIDLLGTPFYVVKEQLLVFLVLYALETQVVNLVGIYIGTE